MRYVFVAAAIGAALLSSGSRNLGAARQQPPASSSSPASAQRALLDQYCVTCHNQRAKTANVTFDTMDLAICRQTRRSGRRAVRKLRGGMMPPPGARRRTAPRWMPLPRGWRTRSTVPRPQTPIPDVSRLHRLNRAEYANAIEDICWRLHVDASALLPADDVSSGFDNIASVLKVSPSFLDQYISAAGS